MNDAHHENLLISFKDSCKNFLHESLNDSSFHARFCSKSDAKYHDPPSSKPNHVCHLTVGFGTHLTVDGDARLITRPA
jgi:hypothetical protein